MLINSCAIHKFGGSSLADPKRFMAIKSLLKGDEIIVVSAIQGTTSALQSVLDEATKSMSYLQCLDELLEKHLQIIKKLQLDEKNLSQKIQHDIFKIQDILYAIFHTGHYSKEIQDYILGYGELWSAMILKEFLNQYNKVALLDASKVLFTYEKEGLINIDWNKSKIALDKFLKNNDFNQLIITGFIASTLEGKRTTLGRNGSDFSAAVFANLFKSKALYIWTDVDGIYSADPNIVPEAFLIESLSYQEALELAYFGAKVLHPMTIAPVMEENIPIYIKNSFNPQKKGTCISSTPKPSAELIKGISCIDKMALISIEGSGLLGVSAMTSCVFNILHHYRINVLFISQANSEHSICFAVPGHLENRTHDVLRENLQSYIERNHIKNIYSESDCSILSIVGDNMVGTVGISSKLSTALAKAKINIRAISQGSSERNISLIIKNSDAKKAIKAIHSGFYLSKKTLSIGLIGPGLVGKMLLQQVKETMAHLSGTYQIDLSVRGIMNSNKMLLLEESIDLRDWQSYFEQHAIPENIEQFIQYISSENSPNAAIIDCTASQHIAMQYQNFMEKGIHIITPNKHANAGELLYYKKLQALTKGTLFYFYEATVCAGLPVISTLQDLIKTGDTVNEIEGIFSGTLSFLFNEIGKGKPFSKALLDAKNSGFTEPDPREDLSGMDVARKLVCLAREIGHEVSLCDVTIKDLIPNEIKSCSLDEFLTKISDYDHLFDELLVDAQSKNQRLYYVGSISQQGRLEVGIKFLSLDHPFSSLDGTDNIILFRTKRYQKRPLIIQGPGAGAEVTAAGIFSDLLRLVAVI